MTIQSCHCKENFQGSPTTVLNKAKEIGIYHARLAMFDSSVFDPEYWLYFVYTAVDEICKFNEKRQKQSFILFRKATKRLEPFSKSICFRRSSICLAAFADESYHGNEGSLFLDAIYPS